MRHQSTSVTAVLLLDQLVVTTAHVVVLVVLHPQVGTDTPTPGNSNQFLSPIEQKLMQRSGPPKQERGPPPQDDGAVNPGSNLFVTGIHPRLSETEVTRLFEKYGEVEKCQIMLDPHTKESRGFGFVKMVTAEQADAAKEGLQGEVIEGPLSYIIN